MVKGTTKKSDSMLPDGAGPEGSASPDFDASELRVNFSDEEAKSEGRAFEPVPGGKYHCKITEWEMQKAGPNAKHPGKPFWHLTLVVQDGPYAERKFWPNVMLFEGALYTLSQLMKAIGREDVLESGNIPHGDTLIGEDVIAIVAKKRDKYKEDESGDASVKLFKNDVTGFQRYDENASTGVQGGSLLPG